MDPEDWVEESVEDGAVVVDAVLEEVVDVVLEVGLVVVVDGTVTPARERVSKLA